jgi:ribonuclease P protein component
MMAVERLHRSREIRAVFTARNVAHGRLVSVHGRTGEDRASSRVAVVAGREVGNAVRRNRARRRLRAAVRCGDLPVGFDMVIRAKAPAVDADFTALRSEVEALAGRVARRAGTQARTGGDTR